MPTSHKAVYLPHTFLILHLCTYRRVLNHINALSQCATSLEISLSTPSMGSGIPETYNTDDAAQFRGSSITDPG